MAVITSMVIVGASMVAQHSQQKKAAKQQKKAYAAQQRQADIAALRERRGALRNSRMQRASIESQAAHTGLMGSSALDASTGNVTSATAGNISFLDQNQMLARQAGVANQKAADHMSRAQLYGQIGNMARSWGSRFGGAGGGSGMASSARTAGTAGGG